MVRALLASMAVVALWPTWALADEFDDEGEGTYSTYSSAEAQGGYADQAQYTDDAEAPPVSQQDLFNQFWNGLSPYGRWQEDPTYGWIWFPNASDFRPYSDGQWVYTDFGWTFVSDAPYGWAVFHYGRWVMTPYGWAWVPGYEWGPAWVDFRYSDGYVGWSPMGPPGVVYEYESYWPWYRGTYSPWVFVEINFFNAGHLHGHCLDHHHGRTVFFASQPYRHNWHRGVPVYEMPSVHHAEPVHIVHAARPVGSSFNGNQISMFRPDRRASAGAPMRPAWTGSIERPRVVGTPVQPTRPAQHFGQGRPESPARQYERPNVIPNRALPPAPSQRPNPMPQRPVEQYRPAAPVHVQPARPAPSGGYDQGQRFQERPSAPVRPSGNSGQGSRVAPREMPRAGPPSQHFAPAPSAPRFTPAAPRSTGARVVPSHGNGRGH